MLNPNTMLVNLVAVLMGVGLFMLIRSVSTKRIYELAGFWIAQDSVTLFSWTGYCGGNELRAILARHNSQFHTASTDHLYLFGSRYEL